MGELGVGRGYRFLSDGKWGKLPIDNFVAVYFVALDIFVACDKVALLNSYVARDGVATLGINLLDVDVTPGAELLGVDFGIPRVYAGGGAFGSLLLLRLMSFSTSARWMSTPRPVLSWAASPPLRLVRS